MEEIEDRISCEGNFPSRKGYISKRCRDGEREDGKSDSSMKPYELSSSSIKLINKNTYEKKVKDGRLALEYSFAEYVNQIDI